MSKSGKHTSAKSLKPGQRARKSGIYEVVGRRDNEIVAVIGKPLPPLPKSAEKYALRAKSGRYIITSPAESANTITTWSKAFKRK
jgi:hypothetical protein